MLFAMLILTIGTTNIGANGYLLRWVRSHNVDSSINESFEATNRNFPVTQRARILMVALAFLIVVPVIWNSAGYLVSCIHCYWAPF